MGGVSLLNRVEVRGGGGGGKKTASGSSWITQRCSKPQIGKNQVYSHLNLSCFSLSSSVPDLGLPHSFSLFLGICHSLNIIPWTCCGFSFGPSKVLALQEVSHQEIHPRKI